MIMLGKTQEMVVDRFSDAGAYLGETAGAEKLVLLPNRYVPENCREGDTVRVFLYRDSEDRPIATTLTPRLELGQMALLKVLQVSEIGAFLDWGLPKDLFLPYKEQRGEIRPGQYVMAALYLDRSDRLSATMHVDRFLSADSPYRRDDRVSGTVYACREDIGAFVAVDGKYFGLIPAQELYTRLKPGDTVEARVIRVRPDGRLNLSPRRKAYAQMDDDAAVILEHLAKTGGILGVGDKSDAELIRTELSLSKSAFKRAAGRLLKEGRIRIFGDHIESAEKENAGN
ncbi:MAG: S1 RNA-binding domain-containing protein [Lachnospiraceae bacterium]|nr:S1 RNA-binding domain-containing protein [Lachnospiraceae bacterium]